MTKKERDKIIKLEEAKQACSLAKERYNEIVQKTKEIEYKVLSENVYTVSKGSKNIGSRIILEKDTWAMDDKSFENYLWKCYVEYQNAGIADERGPDYSPEVKARETLMHCEDILLQLEIEEQLETPTFEFDENI